jgi:hypothetical protein
MENELFERHRPVSLILIVFGLILAFFLGGIAGYLLRLSMPRPIDSETSRIQREENIPDTSSPQPSLEQERTFAEGLVGEELSAALFGKGLHLSIVNEKENTRTYRSPLGFNLTYPATWALDAGIERYPTVAEAQMVAANHFTLYNPGAFQSYLGKEAHRSAKIEVRVYDLARPSVGRRLPQNLQEWVPNDESVVWSKSVEVGGKEARLLRQKLETSPANEADSVYFVDGSRAVTFTLYVFGKSQPDDSDEQALIEIVRSFAFAD